jgi:hypothetical protein
MSVTVAFRPPTNPSDWAPAALPLRLNVETTFLESPKSVRPKKFLLLSVVSHEKAVGIALGRPCQIT